MKILLVFIVLIVFAGCTEDSNPIISSEYSFYGEIAYNSLSESEKATLLNGSEPSQITEGKFSYSNESPVIILNQDEKLYFIVNKEKVLLNADQILVAVFFNTKNDSLLGPIVVIVDPVSQKAVGTVGRM